MLRLPSPSASSLLLHLQSTAVLSYAPSFHFSVSYLSLTWSVM